MKKNLTAWKKMIFDSASYLRNKEEAMKRNIWLAKVSLISSLVVFSIAMIGCFIFESQAYMEIPYVCVMSLCIILLFILFFVKKARSIAYIYITFFILISYSIITSAFISPNYTCVTILIFLFQFPILYLDKGWRIYLAVFLSSVIYLIVISHFKTPILIPDEIINVAIFGILGCIIGTFTRKAQFENFDLKRSLEKYAYIDQLTDLPNRRSFFNLIASSERENCEKPITALAMIDIDHFKDYNDTHGHQSGDECLKKLGECCRNFRKTYKITFFRYGGEEFIAVSSEYESKRFMELCELFRQSIEKLEVTNLDGSHSGITVSMGIAFLPCLEDRKYEKLITKADNALYSAKEKGRNTIKCYDETVNKVAGSKENAVSFRQRK